MQSMVTKKKPTFCFSMTNLDYWFFVPVLSITLTQIRQFANAGFYFILFYYFFSLTK
jgi:hypothetical protein